MVYGLTCLIAGLLNIDQSNHHRGDVASDLINTLRILWKKTKPTLK